jgi:3'-phosphoadenosine 5'-phosphosulfate sulfotransferase (PAPS reductase)/FAD synthetase
MPSRSNPYLLDLPAVVSFSGGRTSAFMLRQILDAHGGKVEGLEVCFQNTGLEHPATLDFVKEVEEQWGVPITWLEYTLDNEMQPTFKVVDYETAARDGLPFTKLIEKKQYLPNPVARTCTVQLKIRTLKRYLDTLPAFQDGWVNAVGLRYDEPRRATRLKGDCAKEESYAPMYHAKHTEEDVLAFWKAQPFDLQLPLTGNMAGNCVGCFLKGGSKLEILMEEMPEHFEWWVEAEKMASNTAKTGARFRTDRPSYASLLKMSQQQGRLFDGLDDDTIPCMCTD